MKSCPDLQPVALTPASTDRDQGQPPKAGSPARRASLRREARKNFPDRDIVRHQHLQTHEIGSLCQHARHRGLDEMPGPGRSVFTPARPAGAVAHANATSRLALKENNGFSHPKFL